MAREIKFRGWDGYIMHHFGLVAYMSVVEDEQENMCPSEAKRTLMQYTGLKDKNGTEIYEGDIYHQGDRNILYTVVYHGAHYIGKQLRSRSYAGLEHFRDHIEVIGNIYENPELIQK